MKVATNISTMYIWRTMFEKTRQEKSSDGGFLSLFFRGARGDAGMSYATAQLRPVVLQVRPVGLPYRLVTAYFLEWGELE